MSTKSSARAEQPDSPIVNLASLPRDEALKRTRLAARKILGDESAVQEVADNLWLNWANLNFPVAVGQTDEQFGDLLGATQDEFFEGLSEGVAQFHASGNEDSERDVPQRVDDFLENRSRFAWRIYNVLAFMVEAVPDDAIDSLPIRCTLVDLREDMDKLATSLMDVDWSVRRG